MDSRLDRYQEDLQLLMKDGTYKIRSLREEIIEVKHDKSVENTEKSSKLNELKLKLEQAKAIEHENRNKVKALSREAVDYSNSIYKDHERKVFAEEDKKIEEAKKLFLVEKQSIKKECIDRIAKIKEDTGSNLNIKEEIQVAKYEEKSHLIEARNKRVSSINNAKAIKNQTYIDHVQENRVLRGGKSSFKEDQVLKFKNYQASFSFNSFLLSNGLYIAIVTIQSH